MYADKDGVAVAVGELDGLLPTAVEVRRYQSGKLPYTVVRMYHVVAYLELINLFECDDGFASACVLRAQCDAMIAFEYLMIGIATYLRSMVHKSRVQCLVDGHEAYLRLFVLEDGAQAVGLFDLVGEDIDLIIVVYACAKVVDEQVKVLVERRLRHGVEGDGVVGVETALLRQLDGAGVVS